MLWLVFSQDFWWMKSIEKNFFDLKSFKTGLAFKIEVKRQWICWHIKFNSNCFQITKISTRKHALWVKTPNRQQIFVKYPAIQREIEKKIDIDLKGYQDSLEYFLLFYSQFWIVLLSWLQRPWSRPGATRKTILLLFPFFLCTWSWFENSSLLCSHGKRIQSCGKRKVIVEMYIRLKRWESVCSSNGGETKQRNSSIKCRWEIFRFTEGSIMKIDGFILASIEFLWLKKTNLICSDYRTPQSKIRENLRLKSFVTDTTKFASLYLFASNRDKVARQHFCYRAEPKFGKFPKLATFCVASLARFGSPLK